MIRRMLFLGALAACALLLANADARASYSYSTSTVSLTGGATGTTANNTPVTTFIPDDNGRSSQILVTLTYAPASQGTVTETVSWFETFNSNTTLQSQTFSIVVVLTLNESATTVSSLGVTATVTPVSGNGFALSFANYNVNASGAPVGWPANLAFNWTVPTAVPEPASLVMLGGGMVGVLGVSLRRMRKKRKVETDFLST